YLAYGAAMGVAAGAVRALPLGSESEREAWSAYGGRWHVVRVRYPARFPPGWGRHPVAATARALATLAVAVFVVTRLGPALAGAGFGPGAPSRRRWRGSGGARWSGPP